MALHDFKTEIAYDARRKVWRAIVTFEGDQSSCDDMVEKMRGTFTGDFCSSCGEST
jgi:hypothetical protein